MVLGFVREVPICAVSAAVRNVFRSDKQIRFNGLVTRAGAYVNDMDMGQIGIGS